jgi:hypothetical protein
MTRAIAVRLKADTTYQENDVDAAEPIHSVCGVRL